jgi:protein required for attachment to host cells
MVAIRRRKEALMHHWIVISNASGARLFERDDDGKLLPRETVVHDASRQPGRQLAADRPGWTLGPSHAGGAALTPHQDPHRHERQRFAAILAQKLEAHANAGDFGEVTIFAAPPFLGELRGHLRGAARRCLREARAVDLCHVGPAELQARIDAELAHPA